MDWTLGLEEVRTDSMLSIMMRAVGSFVSLVLLLAIGVAVPVLAGSAVPVRVSSVPAEPPPGGQFAARVSISDVSDLNAAQYDVSFDPTLLQLEAIRGGQVDSAGIEYMSSQVGPGVWRVVHSLGLDVVSGSGYLSELSFLVVGSPGQTGEITISGGILSGLHGEIVAQWVDSSMITVSAGTENQESTTPTPEPDPAAKDEDESGSSGADSVPDERSTAAADSDGSQVGDTDSGTAVTSPGGDEPTSSTEDEGSPADSGDDTPGNVAEVVGPPLPAASQINWPVVGGVASATLAVLLLAFMWFRRRSHRVAWRE